MWAVFSTWNTSPLTCEGYLSPNPLTRHSRTLCHQGWGCAGAEQGQLLCWPWCLHRVLLAPAEHGVGFQTFRMGRNRAEPTAGVGCHILIGHKWQFSLASWGHASGKLILPKVTGDEQVSLSKDNQKGNNVQAWDCSPAEALPSKNSLNTFHSLT